jgi:hypothetical protein
MLQAIEAGDADATRECIETKAVLPISGEARAKIIVVGGERTTRDDDGRQLLYTAGQVGGLGYFGAGRSSRSSSATAIAYSV